MEDIKFNMLEKRIQQAKRASELCPEDEELKQEYENAKAALKLAMQEEKGKCYFYGAICSLLRVPCSVVYFYVC